MPQTNPTIITQGKEENVDKFRSYFLSPRLSDVIISVGDQEFPCHKLLLAGTELG